VTGILLLVTALDWSSSGPLTASRFSATWKCAACHGLVGDAAPGGPETSPGGHAGELASPAAGLLALAGPGSTRAALIYQHATRERDEAIAAAMGEVLASVRRKGPVRSRSGTYRARRKGTAS
jgi:hypothetical protein